MGRGATAGARARQVSVDRRGLPELDKRWRRELIEQQLKIIEAPARRLFLTDRLGTRVRYSGHGL